MMNFLTSVVAQAAAPAAGAGNAGPLGLSPLVLIVLMFGFMYFFMIRPQQKRQKEHRNLLANLAKGDEVVTNGGIAGRIDEVGEQYLSVEVAPNVKVKLQKGAVSQVLPKGTLKGL